MEAKSTKEQNDAEASRALEAIRTEISMEEPLAPTLKRAIDHAISLGLSGSPEVIAGQKLLSKLTATHAEAALNRALDQAAFDRDCKALEAAIAKAMKDGVSSARLEEARMMLLELNNDRQNRARAISLLEQAIQSRDISLIQQALDMLTNLSGGGVAVGPDADRARRVILEIQREDASSALKNALSSPTVMTAKGFDEEKFLRLWKAVEDAERYLPSDNDLLMRGKSRLEEQKVLKKKCNSAAASVSRAMDSLDINGTYILSQYVHCCYLLYLLVFVIWYVTPHPCSPLPQTISVYNLLPRLPLSLLSHPVTPFQPSNLP